MSCEVRSSVVCSLCTILFAFLTLFHIFDRYVAFGAKHITAKCWGMGMLRRQYPFKIRVLHRESKIAIDTDTALLQKAPTWRHKTLILNGYCNGNLAHTGLLVYMVDDDFIK